MSKEFKKKQDKRQQYLENFAFKLERQNAPYWIGSKPLLAGVKTEGRYKLFFLDPQFSKASFLIFFFDLVSYGGHEILLILNEWVVRYRLANLPILLILRNNYAFLLESSQLSHFLSAKRFSAVIAFDLDEALSQAFEKKGHSCCLLLSHGVKQFQMEIIFSQKVPWYETAEKELQAFLRSKDAGLATLPLFSPSFFSPQDLAGLEMGSFSPVFSPSFADVRENKKSEKGWVTFPSFSENLSPHQVVLEGKWVQNKESIMTEDPFAKIHFWCHSSHVGIVAQSYSQSVHNGTFIFEINSIDLYDDLLGESAFFDETGKVAVRVVKAQLYHCLQNIPFAMKMSLSFRNVQFAPLVIYRIHLAGKDFSAPE